MTINRKICWRKGISQLLILGHRNPGGTCGGIHGNMVYRSHCCGRLCHCINTMRAGSLFTAVSGKSAWHATTVMVFAGGILSRSESRERAHATWEASGLRVRFMQTMWLGWRRVARSSRGGGRAYFFQYSSERPPLKGVPGLSIWWRALRKLRELPGELHGLHRWLVTSITQPRMRSRKMDGWMDMKYIKPFNMDGMQC